MSHIIPFFQVHPYLSLFGMIFIEEIGVFLPFPGDAALLLFGVWSREGRVDFVSTLAVVVTATIFGSSILYWLSRWLGKIVLTKYAHILRFFHITQHNVDMIERWMHKYGWLALVFSRVFPGLRIIGTVAAGVLQVPFKVFLPATIVGTILWTTIFYFAGSLLGRQYADKIDQLLSNRTFFLETMVAVVVLWLFMAKVGLPLVRKWWSAHRQPA